MPPAQRHAWPLTIQAEGFGMPSEIFIYQVGSQADPCTADRFKCIATVSDLYEVPKNQGVTYTDSLQTPFYRRSQLELVLRSSDDPAKVWADVQQQVLELVNNFNSTTNLAGIQVATVTDTIDIENFDMNKPPSYYQIGYIPAGTATYVSSVQGITSPNPAIKGWLPAASAPDSWAKPAGAFLFYNIAQDAGLQAIWPPSQPYNSSQLYRNGMLMPYGITHVFTKDTIWWLKFVPATLPGYSRISPEVQDANAPWPTDWVSPSSPGATPPILTVTIY